jgi:transposase
LPGPFRQLLRQIGEHLRTLDQLVNEIDQQIQQWHRSNEASQRLTEIAAVGPITATAMVASIGDARNFSSGRQLAAWLGLVPRQHSSGGKSLSLGISKRGDCYLRTLAIIHPEPRSARKCSSTSDSAFSSHLLAQLKTTRKSFMTCDGTLPGVV